MILFLAGSSLCILDEAMKGTLAKDAVGLLSGVLHHFAQWPQPPKLLACTHFADLLNPSYLPRHGFPTIQNCRCGHS